jgi:hypothetical protein
LLLRAAVGVTLLVQGLAYLDDWDDPNLLALPIGLSAVACGASLLIGFLTPFACVLVWLGSAGVALSWFPSPIPNLFDARLSTVFVPLFYSGRERFRSMHVCSDTARLLSLTLRARRNLDESARHL